MGSGLNFVLLFHFFSTMSSTSDNSRIEGLVIWGMVLFFSGSILLFYWSKTHSRQRSHTLLKKEAADLGIDKPPAQHPQIDPLMCIGCGSCVRACPEGDVLGLVAGKATIINGLRCVGHGRCAAACPVEAIQVGLGDTRHRKDIPNTDGFGQTNIPGIYIAGELGGLALIRNAIKQGVMVAEAIATSLKPGDGQDALDIVIVGAGPAGLSTALAAKQKGYQTLVLDQEKPGGTILQYPRKKLVLTQPVEIPGYGWLNREEYTKEELLEIWDHTISAQNIPLELNQCLKAITRSPEGFLVSTATQQYRTKRVVLALGRRGTPRKLGVPGEGRSKVMYKLLDASHYQNEHLLVVGGGDSAVEAAIGLAQQPGNTVTISYRKPKFFRIKSKNQQRFKDLLEAGRIQALFESDVTEIGLEGVRLQTQSGDLYLPNHYVFVFAGGIPPFKLMEEIGIQFGAGEDKQPEHTEASGRNHECA